MSEQVSETKRLHELPAPYEGVTDEVFLDLLTDRGTFVKQTIENLKKENPHLVTFVVKSCNTSPDPELSLNWLLTYYEIYSRSARKNGQLILEVFEERIDSIFAEKDVLLSQIPEDDPESIEKFLVEDELKKENIRQAEIKASDELANFWASLRLRRLGQIMSSQRTELETKMVIEPVKQLAILLHAQEEANRLSRKWKVNDSS